MNILTLHSSLPAWPNTSQNLRDSFQPPFPTDQALELHIWSAVTDLDFAPRRAEKILFGFSVGESKTQFFLVVLKKCFLLTLKLKVVDLNVE